MSPDPNAEPQYGMLFWLSYNDLPHTIPALKANSLVPENIEGGRAIYSMGYNKTDPSGNPITVWSDVIFIQDMQGKWKIIQL